MALKLEFCSLIIPIAKIDEKLGDGYFKDHFAWISEVTWHDEHLYRDGCMNALDLEDMLDDWEEKGLELLTYVDGEKHWQDVCVVNSRHGPSFPCDWIEYDPELNIVWLKGQEPGELIGPAGRKVAGEH